MLPYSRARSERSIYSAFPLRRAVSIQCVGVGRAVARFIAPCFSACVSWPLSSERGRSSNNKPSRETSVFLFLRGVARFGIPEPEQQDAPERREDAPRIMQTSFLFSQCARLARCCYCCPWLVSLPRQPESGSITTMILTIFCKCEPVFESEDTDDWEMGPV